MPTSVTGTSTESDPRCRSGGFSLLELLVVVTIIGIFVGVAVLSVGITGPDRQSEQEAFKLKSIIDLIREEALLQSRDFGILFGESSYRFYFYDYGTLAWLLPADDRLLAEHRLPEPLEFALSVEDREVVLDDADADMREDPRPQVMVLSTGEVTPFRAQIFREFGGTRYELSAEFDGSMEITHSAP